MWNGCLHAQKCHSTQEIGFMEFCNYKINRKHSFLVITNILSYFKLTRMTIEVYEVEGWRKMPINMVHGAQEANGAAERHEEGKTNVRLE